MYCDGLQNRYSRRFLINTGFKNVGGAIHLLKKGNILVVPPETVQLLVTEPKRHCESEQNNSRVQTDKKEIHYKHYNIKKGIDKVLVYNRLRETPDLAIMKAHITTGNDVVVYVTREVVTTDWMEKHCTRGKYNFTNIEYDENKESHIALLVLNNKKPSFYDCNNHDLHDERWVHQLQWLVQYHVYQKLITSIKLKVTRRSTHNKKIKLIDPVCIKPAIYCTG